MNSGMLLEPPKLCSSALWSRSIPQQCSHQELGLVAHFGSNGQKVDLKGIVYQSLNP